MIFLFLFSILGGLATALSPCILPILPIVVSSSIARGKLYPLGIVVGLVGAFSLATLFLAQALQYLGIDDVALRNIAAIMLIVMAAAMLLPRIGQYWEKISALLPQPKSGKSRDGFVGGLLVGATLGLVWAPCAGPILATVTTLIATQKGSALLALMLIGFALGIAGPLLAVAYGGAWAINNISTLKHSTGAIRTAFGLITLVTGVLILLNLHTRAADAISRFLPSYLTEPLKGLESSEPVMKALDRLEKESKGPK